MYDKNITPGAVHRSPGIYLTAEENPEEPQVRGCATGHRLKWSPLPPNEVSGIAMLRKWQLGVKGQIGISRDVM